MIFEKVKTSIINVTGVSDEEISQNSLLYDELDIDSLDMAQIALSLENQYKIVIEEELLSELDTVQDLINIIQQKIN